MFSFFYLKTEEDEIYFQNILSSTTCFLVSEESFKLIDLYLYAEVCRQELFDLQTICGEFQF